MISSKNEKETILNEIKNKIKFLGTYDSSSKSNIFYDPNLTLEELKKKNEILGYIVNSHKDPFFRRRLYAQQRGMVDPKYEGMINFFKELSVEKKSLRKKALAWILILHAKKNEILLEYLLQTLSIITHLYRDEMNEDEEIDVSKSYGTYLTRVHNIYRKYFKKADMEDFLDRIPIAFDYREKDNIKCLLQTSRIIIMNDEDHDLEFISKDSFFKELRHFSDISLEFKTIKHPIFSKYIFGSVENYYSLSILDYGKFFFTNIFG